jgi:iron complex outermembrane receptor protein
MKKLSLNLPKLGLASVLASTQIMSYAQAEELESVSLDKVVISAHSFDQGQHEMAQPATLLMGESLERQRATSLGETLSNQTGIRNSSYGTSVGRPVVRGLSGARVKVLQDGIDTLDVSTVSPDHGVNANTHSAKKIEVLRGPSTLMYGSGAFGGVVNVVDERIPTGLAEPETNVRLQYDAVNEGKTVAIDHSDFADLSAGNKLQWRLSASHFRSDEYELPKLRKEHEEHDEDEEEEHEEVIPLRLDQVMFLVRVTRVSHLVKVKVNTVCLAMCMKKSTKRVKVKKSMRKKKVRVQELKCVSAVLI